MIDCTNAEIRDLLPDFLHNALSESDKRRVREHLSGCTACSEELALLQSFHRGSAAAVVNVATVAAAIPRYRRQRFIAMTPLARIAAVVAVVAVGATSYGIISQSRLSIPVYSPESTVAELPDSLRPTSDRPLAGAALDVESLDDETLRELVAEISKMESSISTEPRRLVGSIGSDD
jgi:hypothetical protein